jgi:hypothetical protein
MDPKTMSMAEAVALLWEMLKDSASSANRYREKLATMCAEDPAAELDRWDKEAMDTATARVDALQIACKALTIDPRD